MCTSNKNINSDMIMEVGIGVKRRKQDFSFEESVKSNSYTNFMNPALTVNQRLR